MAITIEIPYSALKGMHSYPKSFRIETDLNIDKEQMSSLLREYRKTEKENTEGGFITFLEKNNISAKILEPTYRIDEY